MSKKVRKINVFVHRNAFDPAKLKSHPNIRLMSGYGTRLKLNKPFFLEDQTPLWPFKRDRVKRKAELSKKANNYNSVFIHIDIP
jgi:hypothetical protein